MPSALLNNCKDEWGEKIFGILEEWIRARMTERSIFLQGDELSKAANFLRDHFCKEHDEVHAQLYQSNGPDHHKQAAVLAKVFRKHGSCIISRQGKSDPYWKKNEKDILTDLAMDSFLAALADGVDDHIRKDENSSVHKALRYVFFEDKSSAFGLALIAYFLEKYR